MNAVLPQNVSVVQLQLNLLWKLNRLGWKWTVKKWQHNYTYSWSFMLTASNLDFRIWFTFTIYIYQFRNSKCVTHWKTCYRVCLCLQSCHIICLLYINSMVKRKKKVSCIYWLVFAFFRICTTVIGWWSVSIVYILPWVKFIKVAFIQIYTMEVETEMFKT